LIGLRPSEAANLRRINLKLPAAGWGEIVLLSSYQPTRSEWTNDGRAGEERSLKHRAAKATRRVPAHPELVVALHQHLSTFGVDAEDRLFVTRTGRGGRPVARPFVRPVSSASTSRFCGCRVPQHSPGTRGPAVGSAPIRPAACLPVHVAGGWSATHPSGGLGRPQRRGAASRLRPRPRRSGRSLKASDRCGARAILDTNRTRTTVDGRITPEAPGHDGIASDQRLRWSEAVCAGGRSRIRTLVAFATDLQSAPIGRSGNLP
jgi:hypothetical protein